MLTLIITVIRYLPPVMDTKHATVRQRNGNVKLAVIIHFSRYVVLSGSPVIIRYLDGRNLFASAFILSLFERNGQRTFQVQNILVDTDSIYKLTRSRIGYAGMTKPYDRYNASNFIPPGTGFIILLVHMTTMRAAFAGCSNRTSPKDRTNGCDTSPVQIDTARVILGNRVLFTPHNQGC